MGQARGGGIRPGAGRRLRRPGWKDAGSPASGRRPASAGWHEMNMSGTQSSTMETQSKHLPLDGVVVIDLSHVYNGPYATFLMAMAGAEVIKVEPRQGEHLRSRGDMGGDRKSTRLNSSN